MLVSFSARSIWISLVVDISALKHRAHIMTIPRIHQAICQDHSGGKPGEGEGLVAENTGRADGEEIPDGHSNLHDAAPLLARCTGLIDVVKEVAHLRLALDGLFVIFNPEAAADIGHDQAAEGSPEGTVHGQRVWPDLVGQKHHDHAGQHAEHRTDPRKLESPDHAHQQDVHDEAEGGCQRPENNQGRLGRHADGQGPAMVRTVAKTRFTQICSAWLASWLRM
jgi:hypothetical protein